MTLSQQGAAFAELAANRLLARLDITHPSQIDPELIAYEAGAVVVYRATGPADARILRSGTGRAIIAISAADRGTPRASFSILHEVAHLLLHDADAIARIHGQPLAEAQEFLQEQEANVFAAAVLIPRHLATPMCGAGRPTLADVAALTRTFPVSLTVAAKRWVDLSNAPCAVVESRGGVVTRMTASALFEGVAVRRRTLEAGTLSLEMAERASGVIVSASPRLHDRAWGAANVAGGIVEECALLRSAADDDERLVLTWLQHE